MTFKTQFVEPESVVQFVSQAEPESFVQHLFTIYRKSSSDQDISQCKLKFCCNSWNLTVLTKIYRNL